jgi:hypothetical protein
MLKGSSGRPDILIIEPNVSPVAIETELLPAGTVEQDAVSRLGKRVTANGRMILSAIAVGLPKRLRTKDGNALQDELVKLRELWMALYTGSSPTALVRWPHSGWIKGSVADLSTRTTWCTQLAAARASRGVGAAPL